MRKPETATHTRHGTRDNRICESTMILVNLSAGEFRRVHSIDRHITATVYNSIYNIHISYTLSNTIADDDNLSEMPFPPS